MELLISNLLVTLILDLGSAAYDQVLARTFTGILNRNYTQDTVSVSSKIECTMFCLNTNSCEAISYEKAAGDSKCHLRKYITNILSPLVLDTSMPRNMSVMVLQKHQEVWSPRSDYTFNSTLKFWYRAVIGTKANVHGANAACKAEGAYLMLIRNQEDFDFVVNIQRHFGVTRMYVQGTRPTKSDGYVDELGRPLPFIQWDKDGLNGPGLHLRTNTDYDMETSYGSYAYRYICQVQLN